MYFYQCPSVGKVVDFNQTYKGDFEYQIELKCLKKTIKVWLKQENLRKVDK